MTLDNDLIQQVDRIVKKLKTNRSAFTRKALREALAQYSIKQQEHKHRQGYERQPVATDEFSAWETEQAWGDE